MKPDIPKKAPGQKMIKRMPLRTKWILCVLGGIILFAFGLSVLANAISIKANPAAPVVTWLLRESYGIVVTCIGLLCFGQAIRFRVMMDTNRRFNKMEREIQRKMKKNTKVPQ
ncbi:hypothetical protein SAMN04515674_11151 [Pseudarcicella hirudinis]|uniref:Uncharacterized protein n=1 Tax=Pseudarcicella hirudinis TaxID=1079859 RepID=A0A1I5W8P2_9BACT|nr:hypothetical protein [Pseudarcicella hirudinis]SFQ16168.1 hypothetical protein SAMN04515674_11151 [Pseudarcicella hirudinis]